MQDKNRLDLSVSELAPIDLSVAELEHIATPDAGDFITGVASGAAVSTIFITLVT